MDKQSVRLMLISIAINDFYRTDTSMMEWKKLLTPQRLGKDTPDELKGEDGFPTVPTPFQKDYNRLVFSSPFRRLKDKTQVFSLAKNDYVRTRLIHSIEVSCVGRSLGTLVGQEIIRNNDDLKDFNASDFGDIVSAACLAHDIGNPPFGHAGEDAIREGFKSWYKPDDSNTQHLTDEQKKDFEQFEGNAQGFRILTRLEMQRDGGMRLTWPTLAAFTKYPRESLIPEIPSGQNGKNTEKYGFFQSEKDLFTSIADKLGLIRRRAEFAWWARHPLAFLVEASDDICYYIVDLEDGYRMGYIPFEKAEQLLKKIVGPKKLEEQSGSEEEQIKHLRALAIDNITRDVTDIFIKYEQKILEGKFDHALISKSRYFKNLKEIKDTIKEEVFRKPEVVRIEIAGYEVLGYFFTEFVNAILHDRPEGKLKLIKHMLPKQYRPTEHDSCYDKILKVTDYISGMTDSYATSLFQELKGISLK